MLDGDGVGRIVSLTVAALGRCALGYLDGRVDDAAAQPRPFPPSCFKITHRTCRRQTGLIPSGRPLKVIGKLRGRKVVHARVYVDTLGRNASSRNSSRRGSR